MWRWALLVVAILAVSAAVPLWMSMQPLGQEGEGPAYPTGDSAVPRGQAYLVKEPRFNFGRKSTFYKGEHAFTLKNVGQAPLELKPGSKSCMCTVANFEGDKKAVALEPGESTVINVTFDTKDKAGKFQQNTSVLTTDPEQPEIFFYIEGDVYPALVTNPDPPLLDMGSIPNDAPSEGHLALWSMDKPDLKVLEIVSSNPEQVTATDPPESLTEEQRSHLKTQSGYRIDVKVLPSPELGGFSEQITVRTDHPNQPELIIPVRGKRTGAILIYPEVMRVRGTTSKGATISSVISVRDQDDTHFEVKSAPSGVNIKIEKAAEDRENDKARHYKITVEIPPGTSSTVINDEIILKADHPSVGLVRLPISGVIEGDE